jgi:hypothetical protein
MEDAEDGEEDVEDGMEGVEDGTEGVEDGTEDGEEDVVDLMVDVVEDMVDGIDFIYLKLKIYIFKAKFIMKKHLKGEKLSYVWLKQKIFFKALIFSQHKKNSQKISSKKKMRYYGLI